MRARKPRIHRETLRPGFTGYTATVMVLAVVVAGANLLMAQDIPARPIGRPLASSSPMFGIIGHVVPLSDGRVLVNDQAKRRVTMLGPDLSFLHVVLDSTLGKDNSYGPRDGALVRHLGDSTLFVEPASPAVLLLDPDGAVVRVMGLPGASTVQALVTPRQGGYPSVSPTSALVFRIPPASVPPPRVPPGFSAGESYIVGDSAAVVALDLAKYTLDTLTKVATGRSVTMRFSPLGPPRPDRAPPGLSALAHADEWGLMVDGTVAVVRGRDYRIEWIDPDGKRAWSPPLPYDWKRLSDADRIRYADSVNRAQERVDSLTLARWIADSTSRAMLRTPVLTRRPTPYPRVDAQQIPDFLPVVDGVGDRVRTDLDNNVWIRPRADSIPGRGSIYDIVNRAGTRIDRLELPANQAIVGFGRGGIVYLVERQPTGLRLLAFRR